MDSWASEHLVNFLLDLTAALAAAWLFLWVQPKVTDYWARRSQISTARKIRKLEERLKNYEEVSSDTISFIGRMTGLAYATGAIFIIFNVGVLLISGLIIVQTVMPEAKGKLLSSTEAGFVLTVICEMFWVFTSRRLISEARPRYYRRILTQRIERLKARQAAQPPN